MAYSIARVRENLPPDSWSLECRREILAGFVSIANLETVSSGLTDAWLGVRCSKLAIDEPGSIPFQLELQ